MLLFLCLRSLIAGALVTSIARLRRLSPPRRESELCLQHHVISVLPSEAELLLTRLPRFRVAVDEFAGRLAT